jgi:hypothetical protein
MPLPSLNFAGGLSPAGASLGLGSLPGLGTALQGQVLGETEEERRRRLQQLQQQKLMGLGGTGGSAAAQSLFSPLFGGGKGY